MATLPLYRKDTDTVIGHLSEPVHIKELKPGDVVWDDCNDEEAMFDGWSQRDGCYNLHWLSMGERGGGFCAWDLDSSGRDSMWRRVVIYPTD